MQTNSKNTQENLVILGSGPAGLTAAIYAARANLNPLVVEGEQPGGQLTITTDVENYPGFEHGIMGPELMEQFRKQASRFGTRFDTGRVTTLSSTQEGGHKWHVLHFENGQQLKTRALIIATGASAKWLGLESEKKFGGRGVSACATCDGFFFRNQEVVVVGGGDTAMEEANFLTKFASKVTLIHRRDSFRASKIMQDKVRNNPKVQILTDTVIEEILGDKAVDSIRVKNLKTNEVSILKTQGVFIAIGHEPNTKPFKDVLPMWPNGYLKVEPGSSKTSVPGIFAAGDVADPIYRQAVTAAGTGCMAALDAERYLDHE